MPAVNDPASTSSSDSPRWHWATKLVVGLFMIVGAIVLIVRFNNYFKLVITAFIISFLLYPFCNLITKRLKISWRISTVIVYLLIAALALWLLTNVGSTIISQAQNLFTYLTKYIGNFTDLLESISNKIIQIGPLQFKLPTIDTDIISSTLISYLQPVATQAGKLVGLVGAFVFNLLITYMVSLFITSETNGVRTEMFNIQIKGFEKDFQRITREVSKIFNAFIRGEFIVIFIAIIIYTVLLGILGLPYFFVLSMIAGFGRFIPYLGAWIGWIGFIIGAAIQDPIPFGMTRLMYIVLVLAVALVIDMLLDHVLTPKLMAESLEVHPAAIMISALVGGQIFGILGIVLAAPTFATLKLILGYAKKKIFDQDPWEGMSYYRKPKEPALLVTMRKLTKPIWYWIKKTSRKVAAWFRKLTAPVAQRASRLKERLRAFFPKRSKNPRNPDKAEKKRINSQ